MTPPGPLTHPQALHMVGRRPNERGYEHALQSQIHMIPKIDANNSYMPFFRCRALLLEYMRALLLVPLLLSLLRALG